MKKILFFCFLLSTLLTNAQLNVNNTFFSPADLILSKLIGDGVSVSNVKYNGSIPNALITNNQLGYYTTGLTPTNLGLPSGLLMTNGSATGAIGPNGAAGSTTASNFPINGDSDLAMIASLSINNICILEFDFVPVGPEVKFEYVFASEEYPEFVGSAFNDVFGFFLSGPGISGPFSNGAKNIALVPNTTTPISINNVNPGLNNAYYVSNAGGTSIQYDGFTTVLTARSEVQCGQTYHIKLALADVGDSAYDSAVFFKEDSFSVPILNLGGDMVGPSKACCGDKLPFSSPFNQTDYPGAVHQWYFENVLVFTSSTSNQFIFDNPSCNDGTLKVVVKPYPTQACTFEDSIVIQYQSGPTLNTPPPLTLCSDTPATATGQFNLNMQINNIIPSFNADYEELGFYTTRDDAYNNVNAIPVASWSAYNGTDNQSIFLGVSNIILTGNVCRSVMEFKLKFVNCDDVDCSLNPSSAVFNLTTRKPIILNGFDPTKYSISFHQSMANAVAGILPITPENAYSLTTNPEEIYVRYWENAAPINRQFTQFTLLATQANFAGNDGNLVFCKDDTVTFSLFDYITGEQVGGTWSIVSGSGANVNLVAGTIASNNSPANYVLEYRVDASSSCPADVSTLNVTINPVCGVQTPPDLILCDDSSNNGIEIFDLSVQNATILGSLSSADYTITYHDDSTDVLSGASPISPITAYPNTSNPQTIYIRVIKNSDGSVFDTSKVFQLIVKPQPVVSNFTGSTTICFGSSTGLVFSGTPNTTIIYSDGTTNQTVAIGSTGSETVPVSPNFTTTYSLISIASNSTPVCTSPASGSVTVTVNQLPLISSTPLNGEACFGEQWTQNFFGTPNATITLTDGTNTYNVVLDATGTQTWVSPALTVNTTFTLTNIASATIPVCNQPLTVPFTISLVPLATASAIGNTTCINTSGQLNFTGSPFSTVSFTDGTTAYTQLLDSSGVGVWTSPVLASNTTYTLTYVTSGSPNVVCDNTLSSTATITVNPNNTVSPASSSPVLCVNTNLPLVTHATTGATGIGLATGLPAGVSASWSGNSITISGIPSNTGIFTYTIPLTGGCGSFSATGSIEVIPSNTVSAASSTPTLCVNTVLTPITHNTTGATGIGSALGLPAGVSASWSGNVITISGMPSVTGTFTYSIPLTGGCGSVAATGTITVNPIPTGIAFVNSNLATCAGIQVNLAVTGTPGTLITWTGSPSSFTLGTTPILLPVTPTTTTTYTLTSATLNGCTIPLNVSATVTVSATPQFITQIPDITICTGGTLNIASQLTSTVASTTYEWSATRTNVIATDGSGVVINSGDETNIDQIVNLINALQSGTINLEVRPKVGTCYGASQQILITVQPIPAIVSTVSNKTVICNNESVTITSNSNPVATMYNWQINTATGVQIVGGATNGTSANGVVTLQLALTNPLVAGTISFDFTPVNGICTGATSVNAVTITVNPIPGTPIGLPVDEICSGETTNLTISSFPNIAGTTLEWTVIDSQNVTGFSNGTGTAPSPINQVLTNTSDVQGYVRYSVTSKLGNCDGGTTEYLVRVNPLPKPVLTDGHICVNQTTGVTYQNYVLDTQLSNPNFTYNWFILNTTTGLFEALPSTNSATYEASVEGTYQVIVTNTVTNCSAAPVQAVVSTVYPATAFTSVVTDAFTNNATITVTVNPIGTGNLIYSLDGGAWQSSNVFTGVEAGTHEILVEDVEGCTNLTESIEVIDYPKYFTPNGDGFNDKWKIVGLEAKHNAKIYIFDRYGKLIKQIDPLGEGWDGKYNGQDIPSTDYWFSVDYTENDQQKQFKAHFSLKR